MSNKNYLVVYHRVDYDGIFSALVAKRAYESHGINVRLLGYNYGQEMPNLEELLRDNAVICIVDISFPTEYMQYLRSSSRVIWIDHHITAIEDSERSGYSDIPGLRRNGTAACELTWEFFNPKKECPSIVQLAGAYDVWNKDRFNWDDDVLPLQFGLKGRYSVNLKEIDKDWDVLTSEDAYYDVIEEGQVILQFLKNQWSGWMSNSAFPVTVDGKYSAICIISPMFSSNSFESVIDKYDLCIVVSPKDQGQRFGIGMYKSPEKCPEFSCGKYLKDLCGGGGHDGAAGGTLSKEQFMSIVFDKVI